MTNARIATALIHLLHAHDEQYERETMYVAGGQAWPRSSSDSKDNRKALAVIQKRNGRQNRIVSRKRDKSHGTIFHLPAKFP